MKLRTSLVTASAALVLLGACTDPARLDPNTNYTRDSAIVGGALGTVAGLAAGGGTFRSGVVGAAVGAGAGALIGNRLDKQAEELRASIGSEDISVTRQGDALIVSMSQDILFDVDSTYVRDGLRDELAQLAISLNNYPGTTAEVIGHTDNTGRAEYNQDLSVRRANAVANIVVANGVSPSRVTAYGRGEDDPIASNLTEEGRAQNRRVDILIRETNA